MGRVHGRMPVLQWELGKGRRGAKKGTEWIRREFGGKKA
jgi:hypothetical protein